MAAIDLVRYRRDGFVVTPDVLDAATVAACLDHLASWLAGPGAASGPIVALPVSDAFLGPGSGLSDRPALRAIAAAALDGAEPAVFGCTYLVKPARSGLPVLWHQDGQPWQSGLGITSAVTLWIALDGADRTNGGLRVIPGSHTLPAQPLRVNRDEPNVFGYEIDPVLVDESLAVQLDMAPGDVSAHHPALIHGSGPNLSDRPRRALAVRYRAAGGRPEGGGQQAIPGRHVTL